MNLFTARRKTVAGIAGLVLLAAPIAACSSESDADNASSESSSSSESSESSAPERVEALATINDLSNGDTTSIALDQGFVDALGTLKLTPGTEGAASLTNDGNLVFDITGGWVQLFEPGTVPNYVVGQIQHVQSGLSLTAGQGAQQKKVVIGNLNVDPGRSIVYGDVTLNGDAVGYSLPLFDLNGSTLKPVQQTGDEVTLTGTEVYLSDAAAELLNQTFGTDALSGDVLVGVATITVVAGS